MLVDYLIGSVLGVLTGFLFNRLAIKQVVKRSNDEIKQKQFKKPLMVILWILTTVLLFNAIIYRQGGLLNIKTIEYLVFIPALINIAAVDLLLRKIPNELLLLLLGVKVIFTIIELAQNGISIDLVFIPALGLFVAFLVFSIPSWFKISIGVGDVKLAGVIGFCFGIYMFFQAMVIMAVLILVYLVYLLISRKGNLKTATAMGPYLSVGIVLTMLFPITDMFLS